MLEILFLNNEKSISIGKRFRHFELVSLISKPLMLMIPKLTLIIPLKVCTEDHLGFPNDNTKGHRNETGYLHCQTAYE